MLFSLIVSKHRSVWLVKGAVKRPSTPRAVVKKKKKGRLCGRCKGNVKDDGGSCRGMVERTGTSSRCWTHLEPSRGESALATVRRTTSGSSGGRKSLTDT